jgi:signal transduction histidine kinase
MLQATRLDARGVERAGASIEANAKRELRLVEDLLDLSGIVAGKLRLALEEVDWRALVLGVVEALKPGAEAKSVQLAAELEGESPICLGDPGRLQQVVGNLLSNAVKFTPSGGRVAVRIDAVDGLARLVVADTGRGIAPAFLPHVFERFAQEEGSTSHHPGLGLGLAIVRHLVELHGGTVRAESPGRDLGSTFTVTLPRHVSPGAAAG